MVTPLLARYDRRNAAARRRKFWGRCLSIADARRPRSRAEQSEPLPVQAVATRSSSGLFSFSGRQWLILLTVSLSTLLFGMTITLANVVLPQIRGSLSASQ